MKEFTEKDLSMISNNSPRIYCDRSELVYDPPDWMKRGLQETATGYGKKLNSGLKIHYCGKLYRIYVTVFSNAGTSWFKAKGKLIYVG